MQTFIFVLSFIFLVVVYAAIRWRAIALTAPDEFIPPEEGKEEGLVATNSGELESKEDVLDKLAEVEQRLEERAGTLEERKALIDPLVEKIGAVFDGADEYKGHTLSLTQDGEFPYLTEAINEAAMLSMIPGGSNVRRALLSWFRNIDLAGLKKMADLSITETTDGTIISVGDTTVVLKLL